MNKPSKQLIRELSLLINNATDISGQLIEAGEGQRISHANFSEEMILINDFMKAHGNKLNIIVEAMTIIEAEEKAAIQPPKV